jgi:peptide-N4-(N-acetyl-beta-glucosaminyl)asparagine amidase
VAALLARRSRRPADGGADSARAAQAGWGKRLTYCIAAGRHGAADVTRRYAARWGDTLGRRELDEGWVAAHLRGVTARLRAELPEAARLAAEAHDAADEAELAAAAAGGSGATRGAAAAAALPGRQTGSAEWVAARGEGGGGGGGVAAVAEAPRVAAATRYRRAGDAHLAAAQPRRVCGGAVRATGENAPEERAERAFDGDAATKWLDFGGSRRDGAWLEYRLLPQGAVADVASYALTSANDAPERDPAHWVVERWDDAAEAWRTVDERRGMRFARRGERLEFPVAGGGAPAPSGRFRLRIVSVAAPSAANSVQLACWDLHTAADR